MKFDLNLNTPEIQAKKEAFIEAAEAYRLAVKNQPKVARVEKPKLDKK
jgi:hypothetical protein